MAIEITAGGTIVTGEDIKKFRLLALRSAMKIEINTGMRASRSNPFAIVKKEFGIKARTKQRVYDEFCKMIDSGVM